MSKSQGQRYRQPPPRNLNAPNKPITGGNNKRPTTNNSMRPKMPLYQEVLIVLVRTANTLGELIISDKFVSFIQQIFQEHIDFLNYVLRNINSIDFWKINLNYSIILTVAFLIKGLFNKTLITFEVFAVIGAISLICIKILDSKGDIIEVTEAHSNYNHYEAQEQLDNETEEYIDEELIEDMGEIVLPTQSITVGAEDIQAESAEPVEKKKASNQDILDTIKQMHSSSNKTKSTEPSIDLLNSALDNMPEIKQKMQYNSIVQQMQERNLLNEAMNPIKDLIAGKDKESESSRYAELLEKIKK